MAKTFRKSIILLIACCLLLLITLLYNFIWRCPEINTIHAINLDKDTDRWELMNKQSKMIGFPIKRWPATYGKELHYTDMRKLGIGTAMFRPDRFDSEYKKLVNLGVIGCFLSTRNLLSHLSSENYPSHYGHLILDDDANIPSNLLAKGGTWDKKRKLIPHDWDIIYLGLWKPNGQDINPGIKKLEFNPNLMRQNLATFAYIVKHSSIKKKILPWLKYMVDAIDEQYLLKFNEWNVYAIQPNIISVNDEYAQNSSINEIN